MVSIQFYISLLLQGVDINVMDFDRYPVNAELLAKLSWDHIRWMFMNLGGIPAVLGSAAVEG